MEIPRTDTVRFPRRCLGWKA